MTYKVEETIAGNIISGPHEFVEEDGPFEGEKYGVTVPGSLYSTGTFDCAVYLKNTSSEDVTVMLYGLAGAFTIKNLIVPADGKFHLCTGTGSMGYDPGGDWDIAVKNNDYSSIDCIEMGTITFYEEGGAPVTNNVLKNAAVTAIESVGANLFGGNSEANPQYIGHYYCELDGSFFEKSDYNAFLIPVEGNTAYYIWSSANALINRAVFHFLDSDKTLVSVDSSLFSSKEGGFTTPANTAFIRFAMSISSAATVDVMLNRGSTALPYTPYTKHVLPIPAEVQALEGWGWGTDAKSYNRLVWDVSGGVKRYRQEVSSIDLGALSWTAQANNVFYGSFAMIAPPAAYPERMRGVLVADYANSTAQSIADMPDKSILRFEWGVAIRDTAYTDAAAFGEAMHGKTMLYARKDPVVTDLPTVLGDDNFIQVEGGGTIIAINENNYDIPYTINYYTANKIDTVYTGKFIGQAVGEFAGSIEASFMVLSSPNGSRFKITIDDSGQLSTTKL